MKITVSVSICGWWFW